MLLWVPASVLVLEQVAERANCFGLRWSMVVRRDCKRYQAFKATADSKMTPSTHVSKAIVAAVLSSAAKLA